MRIGYCVIALHFFATVGGALPLIGKSSLGTPAAPQAAVENCTNFAGDYRGTCTVEDRTLTKSSHVEQTGCESITVDGDEFKIGGLVAKTTSDPISGELARFDWDKDKKNLLVNAAMVVGAGDALAFRGQISLEKGKLVQELKLTGPTVKEYGNCVLTRQ